MSLKVLTRADDCEKHEFDINCLFYTDGKLYSGADDGKIKCWSRDLKLLKQVKAHPCSVYSITADKNYLYSCSNDGTVKVFDLKTLEEKATLLKDDQIEFTRIIFQDNYLYIGDNQGYVRIYKDNKQNGQINVNEPVKDMIIDGTSVYTVKDLDIVITELKMQCEHMQFGMIGTFEGRAPIALIKHSGKFCFNSRDARNILVHETCNHNKHKKVAEIKNAHNMVINALCGRRIGDQTIIYSGGWDRKIKQWNMNDAGDKFTKVGECNVDIVVNTIINGDEDDQRIYAGGTDGHLVQLKYV